MAETVFGETSWLFAGFILLSSLSMLVLGRVVSEGKKNRNRILSLLELTKTSIETPQNLVLASGSQQKIKPLNRLWNGQNYARFAMIFALGLLMMGEGFDALRMSGFGGFSLSGAYLAGRKYRSFRQQKIFRQQFPQFLDILIRGGQVGQSLEQICAHAAKELPLPIRNLIGEISSKIAIGHPIEDVILQTAIEKKRSELHFLAVALSIQRKSGGQYSRILGQLRDNIEAREDHKTLIQSLTAEGRSAAAVVAILTIISSIALLIFSPAQFTFLITDPTGKNMLSYCLSSVVLGLYCINFLVAKTHD